MTVVAETFYPKRSTNVESYSYDPSTEILDVTFIGGRTYRCEGVPVQTYECLCRAPSAGREARRVIDSYAGSEI